VFGCDVGKPIWQTLPIFLDFVVGFGRALWPQALLLALEPHRSPIALQAFAGTKLIEAAFCAGGLLVRLKCAAMRANCYCRRCEACGRLFFFRLLGRLPGQLSFGPGMRLVAFCVFFLFFFSDLEIERFFLSQNLLRKRATGFFLPSPIVVFLNGKGSGKKALERLLVQCQVQASRAGSGCGHGRSGEKTIRTKGIVVQERVVWNGRNGAFWEEFPFGSPRVEGRDENRLRNGEGMSKVKR
jgi:hypothetical protein